MNFLTSILKKGYKFKIKLNLIFYFVFVTLLSFAIYFYNKERVDNKIQNLYYETINLSNSTKDEEKILRLINRYKTIIKISLTRPESYFSMLNLSTLYYHLSNYDESIFFLEKLYANIEDDFYFYSKIKLNLGHHFLDLARKRDKIIRRSRENLKTQYNLNKVVSYYKTALQFYNVNDTNIIFMHNAFYKYLGIAYEMYADFLVYHKDNDKYTQIIDLYKKSNSFYEKLKYAIEEKYISHGKQNLTGFFNNNYYSFSLKSIIRNNVKMNLFMKNFSKIN